MHDAAGPTIRRMALSLGVSRYDYRHKTEALRAVRAIERYNNGKLTGALKKRADDYAIQILGSKAYAPWLYVYALVRGEFKEGWIPDNFFGRWVFPKVNKGLGVFTEYKSLTNAVLRTEALPDLAYRLDGLTYDRSFTPITIAALREIAGPGVTHLFLKKDGVSRGDGVVKIAIQEITEERLKPVGNCVIQLPIRQHAFFDEIVSGSVATIRITTVKDGDGKIEARGAYLRLGRSDNEWVQAKSLVRVAIMDGTGELDAFGYTPEWRRWPFHPDTNIGFAGKRIPRFAKAMETCISLHRSVPHFAILGWDVTVDRDERVQVMEWNGGHTDIKFSEAVTGPCFLGLGWERLKD